LATRVFAAQELEALRKFPEIGPDELFRFFTLTPAEVAFVDPGRDRGPADRLGLAVTLCTLPWIGFVPDDVAAAPGAAVARLAEQLQVAPSAKVIRPGPVTVVERIAHTREEARRETFDRYLAQPAGHST
jgi:hypothetical protein